MNWADLSFGYVKTDYNVRCYYRDGKWGELEVSSSEIINIHMAATCLHYGQEAFEGLKAFRGKDGKVRVFRMDENAKRLQSSSRGIKMAEFLKLLLAQILSYLRIFQEFNLEISIISSLMFHVPGLHRISLNQLIRLLSGQSFAHQR